MIEDVMDVQANLIILNAIHVYTERVKMDWDVIANLAISIMENLDHAKVSKLNIIIDNFN